MDIYHHSAAVGPEIALLLFASPRKRRTDKDHRFRLLMGFSQTRLSSRLEEDLDLGSLRCKPIGCPSTR